MVFHHVESEIRIDPPFPIEQIVTVDGKRLRVSLEWPLIRYLLGEVAADPQAVREMLHERRLEIDRTIKAHVFAHGVPLSRAFSLSVPDFRAQAGAQASQPPRLGEGAAQAKARRTAGL